MGNKIITEKDFWVCSLGAVPAPLQAPKSRSALKESGHRYITVADTATSSVIDFGCTRLMWIMAIAAAALAVLTVATGGAALIAIGALAGAAGAIAGAVLGALLCGQKIAALRKWESSKSDLIIQGQRAITGADKMKCIIGGEISFAPDIKNWWQAISLGAANYLSGILEGMMWGAFAGALGMVGKGAMAALSQFGVKGALSRFGAAALSRSGVKEAAKWLAKNAVANYRASWWGGGWGLGLRGVVTAQSALDAYGRTGEAPTREDVIKHGIFGMETGTGESVKKIFTGQGTMTDVIGVALWFTPVHKARNQLRRPRSEEAKNEEAKNEEAKNEENPQARTDASNTPRRQGEFEAYEEGKKVETPAEKRARLAAALAKKKAADAAKERLRLEAEHKANVADAEKRGKLPAPGSADRIWLDADPTGRRKELAYDPAQDKFRVQEARAALEAEANGKPTPLPPPVRRSLAPGRAETGFDFIDGAGAPWDHVEVRDPATAAATIEKKAHPPRPGMAGENAMVDLTGLSKADAQKVMDDWNAATHPPGTGEVVFALP